MLGIKLSEEILSNFKFFGLEKIDVILYTGLLQYGPISIGKLAATLEIERGKAYRTLDKLKNLGIVKTTFSNPITCSVIPLADVLTTLIEKKEDEITIMTNIRGKLVKELDTITRTPVESSISSITILQGRINNYSKIAKMISEAQNNVYIMTTVGDLMRMHYTNIPDEIKNCKKRGVEVKILTALNNEKELQIVRKINATEIRICKLPSQSRMVIEENMQLLMSDEVSGMTGMSDDNDSALYTNSPEMINNMQGLFVLLWKKSKKQETIYGHLKQLKITKNQSSSLLIKP